MLQISVLSNEGVVLFTFLKRVFHKGLCAYLNSLLWFEDLVLYEPM